MLSQDQSAYPYPVATPYIRRPSAARTSPPAVPGFGLRTRRALAIALVLSLALHVGISFWPAELREAPESTPLTATLTEMPAPPVPGAA